MTKKLSHISIFLLLSSCALDQSPLAFLTGCGNANRYQENINIDSDQWLAKGQEFITTIAKRCEKDCPADHYTPALEITPGTPETGIIEINNYSQGYNQVGMKMRFEPSLEQNSVRIIARGYGPYCIRLPSKEYADYFAAQLNALK